jgi:hypothetical protein
MGVVFDVLNDFEGMPRKYKCEERGGNKNNKKTY